MFLNDKQIAATLRAGSISIEIQDENGDYSPIAVPADDDLGASRLIQSSSIDLTIGRIYVPPGEPRNAVDRATVPFESGLQLSPGQTAVVETRERLHLGKRFGAFGFPPAGVSKNSILMTNPGHVDPGYSGHLSFTLINMGRKPYRLYRGDRIASLLLFKLSQEAAFGYSDRNAPPAPKWAKLLDQLSPDFAAFQTRLDSAARLAVEAKTADFEVKINEAKNLLSVTQVLVPLFTALFAGFLTYFTATAGFVGQSDFDNLKARVQTMEVQSGAVSLQKDVADLATKVKQLEAEAARQDQLRAR